MKSFSFVLRLALLAAFIPIPSQAQAAPAKTNDAYTLELLRRTLEEQKQNPGKIVPTLTNLPAATATNVPAAPANVPASSDLAELERQYLAGKISAKQYEKAVEQFQKKAAAKTGPTVAMSPKAAAAAGIKVAAPQPAIPTPPPQPNPNLKKLSDVDIKIEEMMKRNMERQKAAAAAAAALPTSNPDGTPLTKRQRLDLLLRQVVEGKITDEEYKAAREKIGAEPD